MLNLSKYNIIVINNTKDKFGVDTMNKAINYELRVACTEVIEIIKIMGDYYKNKLPLNIIDALEKGKIENYKTNINPELEIDEQNLSRKTIAILAMLNLVYWVEDKNEKNRLLSIYVENDKKQREKINEVKTFNSFNEKIKKAEIVEIKKEEKIQNEESNLPVKVTFLNKIKKFFIKLLKKNKEE